MIVMAKPMLLTIVSAVPLVSGSVLCATRVENNGESAITTIPQKSRKANNSKSEFPLIISGETRQHKPDKNKAKAAVFLVPNDCDIYPPITLAGPPMAMIRNDQTGILRSVSGCKLRYVANIMGTNAQKAYTSHIWPK